jgi:hypothetical protein
LAKKDQSPARVFAFNVRFKYGMEARKVSACIEPTERDKFILCTLAPDMTVGVQLLSKIHAVRFYFYFYFNKLEKYHLSPCMIQIFFFFFF